MGVTVTLVLSTRSGFFAHFLMNKAWSPLAWSLVNGARARAVAGPAEPHCAQHDLPGWWATDILVQPASSHIAYFVLPESTVKRVRHCRRSNINVQY